METTFHFLFPRVITTKNNFCCTKNRRKLLAVLLVRHFPFQYFHKYQPIPKERFRFAEPRDDLIFTPVCCVTKFRFYCCHSNNLLCMTFYITPTFCPQCFDSTCQLASQLLSLLSIREHSLFQSGKSLFTVTKFSLIMTKS